MSRLKHVSASQIELFESCKRKWVLQYIKKFPREAGDHFAFGTALHRCCENILNEKGPFSVGWHSGVGLTAQYQIDSLMRKALEEKVLPLHFGQSKEGVEAETNFVLWPTEDVPLVGFIDRLDLKNYTATDWKTSASWKYAKTKEELARNIQMCIYAKVILQLVEEDPTLDTPEFVRVEHGVFLKVNKYSGRAETDHRSKLTSADVPTEDVEDFWQDTIIPAVKSMKELAEADPAWYDVEGPSKEGACEAFGGCSRKRFCQGKETEEEHRNRMADKAK